MKFIVLFLFGFLSFQMTLVGQEQSVGRDLSYYANQIDTFSQHCPHEKVYLHFDNTSYFLGDTIWFKAYLINASAHRPDNWSRTLYVELLTQEGDIMETKKYKVTDGQCHGFLPLKRTYTSGYYEVRAYTRWMLNFGSGHEFSRVFAVFDKPKEEFDNQRVMGLRNFKLPNNRKDDLFKWEKRDPRVTMDFFPEGGHLVEGLPCRVAFKAFARDSGYLEANGYVSDKTGKQVAYFSTVHDGMGIFEFVPEKDTYTATLNVDGKSRKFSLPVVEKEGCSIRLDVFDPEKIRFSVYRSDFYRNQTLGITVMCRGRVSFFTEIPPSSSAASGFSFSRDELPTGVNQITLFNSSGEVLAERLLFVDHKDALQMDFTQKKNIYDPFEKVNMDFSVRDQEGHPVSTTFSLAIRDAERSLRGQGSDILSYLLLSSEIRGYVHDPGYYFESNDHKHRYALDLLLMTQGWSRYVWKRLAGSERFKIENPAEESISIDGVARAYSNKFKPIADAEVLMWMMKGNEALKGKERTDENGNFVFAFDFSGTYTLSIQVKKDGKRKNCDIRLNRFRTPPLRKLEFYERQLPQEDLVQKILPGVDSVTAYVPPVYADSTLPKDVAMQLTLREAKVKRRRVNRDEPGIRNASIIYKLDPIMDKLKDRGEDKATTLFEFLTQMNPYYYTERPLSGIEDRYKGRKVTYVSNINKPLDEIALDEIESIVINESFGAALLYLDPSPDLEDHVLVYIRVGKTNRETPKGIRTTKMDGYALVKEFYNPRYDRGVLPGETDYRHTLYWNPNVRTDSLGQAKVVFYNNGTCKRMDISAQTVTLDGQIGTTGL